MSVNLMSAIFEVEFFDLKDEEGNTTKASTAKLILLAMADHANDEGEGAYPSMERLCKKTALSEQTIRNTFDALRYNGVITLVGKSKYSTNNHTINTSCFPRAIGKEVTYLTIYPLDPPTGEVNGSNRSPELNVPVIPESSLDINKPSTQKKSKLPAGSDLGFALAAGISSEEIAAQNIVMEREKELLNWYESKMGYTRPLDWWTDDKLKDLRKFLVMQTKEDIETFAKWTRRDFSKFGPENAKRYPNDVITFWGLAFPDKASNLQSEVTDDAHGSPMSW